IGTKLLADLQAIVARAGQNDGLRAKGLGNSDAEESDWSGTGHHDTFTRNEAAELRQAVHGGTSRDDQSCLLVRHVVGDADQRIDIVDLILAEAAVGGEAVGPMSLVDIAV